VNDHPQDDAADESRGHRDPHSHNEHADRDEGHDHGAMIADFRRRFWVSLALTVPILLLSPMIQGFLALETALAFPGDRYLLFVLAVGVFFYGGWPFLTGLVSEVRQGAPGMMTLIGLAISVAFLYSSAVVFGQAGRVFFWELGTLVDVMLMGHWIEMRSIRGATGALEALVRLMPATTHRLTDAVESADIVLVNTDPRDVTTITELSAATDRKMIQNLWWAAGYNIVAIALAAGVLYGIGVLMPPAIGAAVMSLSTIVVAINAKLLERFRPASASGAS